MRTINVNRVLPTEMGGWQHLSEVVAWIFHPKTAQQLSSGFEEFRWNMHECRHKLILSNVVNTPRTQLIRIGGGDRDAPAAVVIDHGFFVCIHYGASASAPWTVQVMPYLRSDRSHFLFFTTCLHSISAAMHKICFNVAQTTTRSRKGLAYDKGKSTPYIPPGKSFRYFCCT